MGMLGGFQAGDPEQVGPYRLLDVLGSGGFGRVFLGRSADGQLAAVKLIRSELADPEFRVRFRREVAAARKVGGRFTAQVIDTDAEGPVPWLATAYVPGPSLAAAVARHGPLPVGSVLALAAGLTEALAAIHAAGLVHRDLKPENVLLAEDGPRVIDFGIARAVGASTLTGTGTLIGTFGFMSPEQVRGDEVGPPSDVFSLGSVLVFAATGQGPFGTVPTAQLLYRVAHQTPNLDQVPQEIRPLVQRCLAAEPGYRPAPCDLVADLRSADPAAGWLPAPVTRATQGDEHPGTERVMREHPGTAPDPVTRSVPALAGLPASRIPRPDPDVNSAASLNIPMKIGAIVTAAVVAVTLAAIYAAGHLTSHHPVPGAALATSSRASSAPSTSPIGAANSASRPPNVLALSDQVRAEQVELDSPDDAGDARLTGLAGREVTGFLGLAGAGPVRTVAGEGARGEDLEQERGEREIGLLRGKKPRPCLSRRPGHAGS